MGCAFAACLERKQRREKECGVTAAFDASRTSFAREGSFRGRPAEREAPDKKKGGFWGLVTGSLSGRNQQRPEEREQPRREGNPGRTIWQVCLREESARLWYMGSKGGNTRKNTGRQKVTMKQME